MPVSRVRHACHARKPFSARLCIYPSIQLLLGRPHIHSRAPMPNGLRSKIHSTPVRKWESECLVRLTLVGASYHSSCPRIVSAIAAVECAKNFKTCPYSSTPYYLCTSLESCFIEPLHTPQRTSSLKLLQLESYCQDGFLSSQYSRDEGPKHRQHHGKHHHHKFT
jgi:hypothetical protein